MIGKKILIHTQEAKPNEDFITDIQLPLFAERVTGMIVNAFDRTNGVTVSWGSETLSPSYTPAQFLIENQTLASFIGRNVITDGGGNDVTTMIARDKFVNDIIDVYISELIKREVFDKNKEVFTDQYLKAKKMALKDRIGSKMWLEQLGIDTSPLKSASLISKPLQSPGTKTIWEPSVLMAWYQEFSSFMVSNPSATTSQYRETFFSDAYNFSVDSFESAKVYVYEGGEPKLVYAFTYFASRFGNPSSIAFGYSSTTYKLYSFDSFRTAEITLNWFYQSVIYLNDKAFLKNLNWDNSVVGELSVMFNSGRDIVIRDMIVDLNNNSKSIHNDIIPINQEEQVNSFVRLVFKNNGKWVNPFYLKSYFFYECKQ